MVGTGPWLWCQTGSVPTPGTAVVWQGGQPSMGSSAGMAPQQCRRAGHCPPSPGRPAHFTPGRASSLQLTEIPTWPIEVTEFAISGPETLKSRLLDSTWPSRLSTCGVPSLISSPCYRGSSAVVSSQLWCSPGPAWDTCLLPAPPQ